MYSSSSRLAIVIAISVCGGGLSSLADAQNAREYVPPVQCPPKHIPTTRERGCILDRSADFEMGRGKYARSLTLPASGVSTVPPRNTNVGDASSAQTSPRK
jgi:hypothetical protein